MTCRGEEISGALYHLGIMTDIMRTVAAAHISGNREICGSHIEWLAQQLQAQHERIEVATNHLTGGHL